MSTEPEKIFSYFDGSEIGTITHVDDGLTLIIKTDIANLLVFFPAGKRELLEVVEHIHQGARGTCVCGIGRRQRMSIRVKASDSTMMGGYKDPDGCSRTIAQLWPPIVRYIA